MNIQEFSIERVFKVFFTLIILIIAFLFFVTYLDTKNKQEEIDELKDEILNSSFIERDNFILSGGYFIPNNQSEDFITKNKRKKVFLECVVLGKPKGKVTINNGCSITNSKSLQNRLGLYIGEKSNTYNINLGFFNPEYKIIINNQEELVAEYNDKKNKHLLKINKINKEIKLIFKNKDYQKRELILKKVFLRDL